MKKEGLLTIMLFVAVCTFLSCERSETAPGSATGLDTSTLYDTIPTPATLVFDTLPNSEWWKCNNVFSNDSTYLLLNISWENGLLNSYTNMRQNPQFFINNIIIPFHIVNDTIFYDGDYSYFSGWRISQVSDTTMLWSYRGMTSQTALAISQFFFIIQ